MKGSGVNDPSGCGLDWLFYNGNVIEPVLIMHVSSMTPYAVFKSTFRGVDEMMARLTGTLEKSPYLLGDTFSAADLLIVSAFFWFPNILSDNQPVQDWVERCRPRAAYVKMSAEDAKRLGS